MLDPHKMVLIGLLSFLFVTCAALIYTYIYPKRKINLLSLLVILSIPPIVSIFRPGSYESGDFAIHVYRTIEFYQSLTEGIILPSWAAGLNATYGYPLFIFNYPLPYYLISFFHSLGFSFIVSMKLFLAINYLLSGIFMYICAKKLFKNDIAAFTSSIFYQFAPYHLIDLHFKAVIGEILIFTLIPLAFFFLQKLMEQKNGVWFSLAGITISLLIMAHVVLALFSMILFFFYALFITRQTKNTSLLFTIVATFVVGSISTLYIWATPFFMSQYTIFEDVHGSVYYPQIWELLFSPWKLGFLFQGSYGELSFLLGYTHIFAVLALTFLLITNRIIKKYKPNILFWILALSIIIFFITPYSKFIWDLIPFLKITGSHRLLVLAAFTSAILAGYLSFHLHKTRTFLVVFILITILSTVLNWGQRRVIPEINDRYLINKIWESTSEGEGHFYANSKWRDMKDPWFSKLPLTHLEVTKGEAEIKEIERTSVKHIYEINAQTPIIVRESTLYFPGWGVFSNKTPYSPQPDEKGIITFALPQGLQLVEVMYTDITIYKVLKLISISGFVTLLFALLIFWRRAYGR